MDNRPAAAPRLLFYGPPHYRTALDSGPAQDQGCGLVCVVTLTPEAFEPSQLSDTLDFFRRLERRLPRVSLVAALSAWDGASPDELGVALQALSVTDVLLSPTPVPLDTLRRVLTTTVGLPRKVARWFRIHADLKVGEAEVMERLVQAGLDSPAEHRLPKSLDSVTRKGVSFASAAALFTLGRGLGNALALQRREAGGDGRFQSHEAVALRRGFSTGGSLSRHLGRTFSVNARYISHHLGWPWLMGAWSSGRARRGSGIGIRRPGAGKV